MENRTLSRNTLSLVGKTFASTIVSSNVAMEMRWWWEDWDDNCDDDDDYYDDDDYNDNDYYDEDEYYGDDCYDDSLMKLLSLLDFLHPGWIYYSLQRFMAGIWNIVFLPKYVGASLRGLVLLPINEDPSFVKALVQAADWKLFSAFAL